MKKHLISTFILIAYSAILIKVMVFKDVPLIRIGSLMIYFGGSQTGPANLVPFKTILVYLLGEKGLIIGGINLIGNIILLVPVGLLGPLAFPNITWKKMLALAVAAGFAIEGLQVILSVGIFDIDDVILNGLGVIIGYWAFTVLAKKLSLMEPKSIKIAAVVLMGIIAGTACYGLVSYHKGQFPVRFEPGPESGRSDRADKSQGGIPQGNDPCGGTGGLGEIVNTGNHAITIQRSDGGKVIIKLTSQTTIRNSTGTILVSDLKIGNRVTIVTYESDPDGNKIATAVLVCNTPNQGS
nr:VanZ family protein [uncultured Pedobacter sp.]